MANIHVCLDCHFEGAEYRFVRKGDALFCPNKRHTHDVRVVPKRTAVPMTLGTLKVKKRFPMKRHGPLMAMG